MGWIIPTVNLQRGPQGKLVGISDKDERAYAKFRARLDEIGPRESIVFTWKEPRSGPFHRRHFAMLAALYNAQEVFADDEQFRKWGEAGAGFADLVVGPKGKPLALVKSIAYEKLDEAEFRPLHDAIFQFYRSEHARRFLWPHLDDEQSLEMVMTVLGEFE